MTKTQKYKENILFFAEFHNLIFVEEGFVGWDRPCVGLAYNYELDFVAYNPIMKNYSPHPKFYDIRFDEAKPKDAYHKDNYIAVLGRGLKALKQLSEWVDKLDDISISIHVSGHFDDENQKSIIAN